MPAAANEVEAVHADEQVALLLKFALTIGPIAVYFLTLGFLNAQPRPQLVSGRTDFALLAIVFFPVALWAMLALVNLPWPFLIVAAGLAAAGFYRLLPPPQSSWVIYNVSARQFQRALGKALDRLGWSAETCEADRLDRPTWLVPALALRIRVSAFPLLSNVTCLLDRTDGRAAEPAQLERLRGALREQLGGTHTLPSASAACFLLIGTLMLSTPLLMMARHMDAVVKVVRSLFA